MADRNALLGAPYSFPVSEYTTQNELMQERISSALGWDTSRPGQEFLRRLPLLLQALRSPAGARVGNEAVWAARTPSGITGGNPRAGHFTNPNYGSRYYDSTAGLRLRMGEQDPFLGRGGAMRDITPEEMGFYGPSAPANSPAGQAYRNSAQYYDAMDAQAAMDARRSLFDVIPGGRKD